MTKQDVFMKDFSASDPRSIKHWMRTHPHVDGTERPRKSRLSHALSRLLGDVAMRKQAG